MGVLSEIGLEAVWDPSVYIIEVYIHQLPYGGRGGWHCRSLPRHHLRPGAVHFKAHLPGLRPAVPAMSAARPGNWEVRR